MYYVSEREDRFFLVATHVRRLLLSCGAGILPFTSLSAILDSFYLNLQQQQLSTTTKPQCHFAPFSIHTMSLFSSSTTLVVVMFFFAFNIHDGGRVVASSEILGLVKDKLGDLDLSLRMIPAL